jgi:hypothetical protein
MGCAFLSLTLNEVIGAKDTQSRGSSLKKKRKVPEVERSKTLLDRKGYVQRNRHTDIYIERERERERERKYV